MRKHLGIFSKEHIKEIFDGKLLIDLRFSQKRIPPFGLIARGDLVYIKQSGGDVIGQFKVKKVISFDGLDFNDWEIIIKLGTKKIKKNSAKYLTLIYMTEL